MSPHGKGWRESEVTAICLEGFNPSYKVKEGTKLSQVCGPGNPFSPNISAVD